MGPIPVSPTTTSKVIKEFEKEINMLLEHCNSTRRILGSAAVQTAAVFRLRMDRQATDYILDTYRNMVLGHLNELPNIAVSFINQTTTKGISSSRSEDLFIRAFFVFDFRKSKNSTLSYKDRNVTIGLIKERFLSIMDVI